MSGRNCCCRGSYCRPSNCCCRPQRNCCRPMCGCGCRNNYGCGGFGGGFFGGPWILLLLLFGGCF